MAPRTRSPGKAEGRTCGLLPRVRCAYPGYSARWEKALPPASR